MQTICSLVAVDWLMETYHVPVVLGQLLSEAKELVLDETSQAKCLQGYVVLEQP